MQNCFLENEHSIVFVTCSSINEARHIAKELIENRLAACVSIIPEIISTYRWENKVQECTESKLMIKTRASYFEKITEKIKSIHSAILPEIIEIRISNSSNEYRIWLSDETE